MTVSIRSSFLASPQTFTQKNTNQRDDDYQSTPKEIQTTEARGSNGFFSSLSLNLAAGAGRADARDREMTPSQLTAFAGRALSKITGEIYFSAKTAHDLEVPRSKDAARLARAKAATLYLNDDSQGGRAHANPFSGFSRQQLADITYDESGQYTVNERRAAWSEAQDQEEKWRVAVVNRGMAEYNATGKQRRFQEELAAHFWSLPLIERARYPQEFVDGLSRLDGSEDSFKPFAGLSVAQVIHDRGGSSAMSEMRRSANSGLS